MKIAIPLSGWELCVHFGHCKEFMLVDVDEAKKTIAAKEVLAVPPHQPGLLPIWLADKGVNVIIAGGMGLRAKGLFEEKNIKVVVGVEEQKPDIIVEGYLNGTLKTGSNICDH